jgi:hypothetical protein
MSVVIDSDNNNIDIVQEPINVTISTGGADVSAVWGNISGDLTEQEDLQAALDNKVPYTGATQDVNLGEFGAQLGNLEFDTTPTNTPTGAGSVYWSDTDGTLNLVLKGGQTISRIGETQHIRALNNTGTQIARGKVVYVVGAQGQRLTVALADADTEILSKDTIGFTSESIADGAEGFVIVQGVINNISTTGMTDGATVYLSQTAGGYTTTPPPDPAHLVVLGFIVNGGSGGAGSIYVKVDNGYELEELHNVSNSEKATAVDADAVLLRDSADNNLWKRLTWANVKSTLKTYFDTLYQGTLTFDSTPTNGSTNPVTSDGVFDALALKQDNVTLTTTGTSGAATLVGATLNIPQYQAVLTNPVTGTGVSGQVSYWTGTNTQGGSQDLTWNDTTKILSFSNGGTLINEIRVGSINSNTIMGRAAGSSASLSGGSNSFFGQNAGSANTTGNGNTAFGLRSGNNNTTGSGNLFLGSQAGRYISDGSNLTIANNSVFAGFDTRAAADNQTNQTVIGYSAIGLGSNTTVIGNSSTTLTWLGGSTSIGTTTSSARLHVRGSGTTSSTTALLVQNSTPSALLTILDNGASTFSSSVTANSFVKSGGTSTQYLMADGSTSTLTNPVTGTGVAGQVSYWAGTGTQTGSANLFWDAANSRLGIGTATPTLALQVERGSNGAESIWIRNANTGAAAFGALVAASYGVSPSTTGTVELRSHNFNNSVWPSTGMLVSNSSLTNGLVILSSAGNITFNTTSNGTERARIESGGNFVIGTTSASARLHVRGSGTTSATTALLVQNSAATELLTVRDDNRVIAHGGIFTGGANTVAGILPQGTINQENILIRSSVFPTTGSITDITLTNGQGDPAHTSGTRNLVNINRNFSPTSGSGIYNLLLITSTINQTGGANGITRGLYVNPTLTAAADWRSVEFSNNTGWGLYGAGTANNYLAGGLGIGSTSLSNSNIRIAKPLTGGTIISSVANIPTINSDVTAAATIYTSLPTTQAASFVLSTLNHYLASSVSIGAGSSITDQYGFNCSNLTQATNNYGFYGNIASGTGRWNLYMNGTAANYLAGNTSIGTTTSSGRLTVRGSGTTSATNGLLIEDSGGTDTLTIRDDGGYAFKGGTVGLAQTGYTTFTNLVTDRTCDANATTVDELADILGTLIEDLKTKGIISA